MAWTFGDGFDCYAAPTDAISGYWDSGGTSFTLGAGRFAGSQCVNIASSASQNLGKISAVNDVVHHISVAYRQTAALSGATLGLYFQLIDNVTNQCCIVFRQDGVILLTSATPGGSVLATYPGAVTAANTWFQFEFEVVINNTTGRFRARKNGNTSDDFDSGATLNTRPGVNSYANKIFLAQSASVASTQIDDLLWRSDASSVPWVGDIRCYTRMPASDASVQFSRTPTSLTNIVAISSSRVDGATTSVYTPFIPAVTGTVGTISMNMNTGFTGNMKCSIFADTGAVSPGAVLGSATPLVNPVTGNNVFTFGTPVAVAKGVQYWFGISHDVSATVSIGTGTAAKTTTGVTYAAFPTASPSVSATGPTASTVTIGPTLNCDFVNETLQDATTSYVYDATVNDADLYNIAATSTTPATVVAVTTRGFVQKSDAGAKSAAVQLKSGATTVASTSTVLATTFGWLWRTDTLDPATGAAWTNTAVNNVQIGPKVTA